MLKIKINFEFDDQAYENLENNLPYVSSNIISFKINKKAAQLDIETDPANEELVKGKVVELINKLKPVKKFEPKVYFDHLKQSVPCQADIFEALVKTRQVVEVSPGLLTLSGLPMDMMEALDVQIKKFAKTLNAQETLYPISTPIQSLKEAHFFKRTPQHANFISLLSEESEKISDFAKQIEKSEASEVYKYFNTPQHICRAAICSNAYPGYKNKVFGENETVAITTVGRAFRNESKNVHSLERLHEFSMREIIFIGHKKYISDGLLKCTDWFINFMKEAGLKGIIKTAGDAFYADNLQALQFYQMAEQSKFEFRLVNPFNEHEVSCGSINNHGTHFSKSYGIMLQTGDYANSGCVGFGYERTVFLVLSQYGLNKNQWPQYLRDFFSI